MSSWKECKLGDFGNVVTGKTPSSKNPEDWGFEMPFVTPSDYKNYGKFALSGERNLSKDGISRLQNKILPENSIMVTCIGSDMGKVAMNKIPVITNQQINSIIPDSKTVDSNFLYYRLVSLYETLRVYGSDGTAVPIVNKTDFENIETEIPPLEEQKAIAEILSSLDDKIDLLHRQNQTLESLAQTLFRQWFIEEAKEEWEEKPLGELLTITSSKRIFYSEYVDNGVPFYRSKEIIELHNMGSTKSELYITEERFNEIIQKFGAPQEGDILLTSVGTLGIPYRVNADDRFYFKDGNLTWFKDFTIISSIIIFYWLKSDIGKEQLDSITIGSTQSALTISGLKEIKLPIPPKETIERLTDELNSFDEKISQNKKQIQTLENLRDTLLPKLLTGEVRVEI